MIPLASPTFKIGRGGARGDERFAAEPQPGPQLDQVANRDRVRVAAQPHDRQDHELLELAQQTCLRKR